MNKRHYQATLMLVSPWLCQRVSIVSSSCNVTFFPIAITDFWYFVWGRLLKIVILQLKYLLCNFIFLYINCNSLYYPGNGVKVGRHECFGLYLYVCMYIMCMSVRFLYLLYIFLIQRSCLVPFDPLMVKDLNWACNLCRFYRQTF